MATRARAVSRRPRSLSWPKDRSIFGIRTTYVQILPNGVRTGGAGSRVERVYDMVSAGRAAPNRYFPGDLPSAFLNIVMNALTDS